jgi:hypothetical protein
MYAQGDATVSIKMPDKYEGVMSIEIVELMVMSMTNMKAKQFIRTHVM